MFSAAGAPLACRAPRAGACWAVIGEKLRLILFGIYPYAQQWRPAIAAMVLLVAMYALSVQPRLVELATGRGVAARARRLRRS